MPVKLATLGHPHSTTREMLPDSGGFGCKISTWHDRSLPPGDAVESQSLLGGIGRVRLW
jgi:hypothetical protein